MTATKTRLMTAAVLAGLAVAAGGIIKTQLFDPLADALGYIRVTPPQAIAASRHIDEDK